MEISEDIKELYNYVEQRRHKNGGKLTAPQAGAVLDKLFFIHRALVIDEYRPPRPAARKVVSLDAVLLARGGTIRTYRRPSFLKRLFNRRLT